jgi:uncharacterized Rmd1/YagE family protein
MLKASYTRCAGEVTSPTRLYNDQVCLSSNSALEKLSVSFALAQSCKLSV